jgi:hypothetical protein
MLILPPSGVCQAFAGVAHPLIGVPSPMNVDTCHLHLRCPTSQELFLEQILVTYGKDLCQNGDLSDTGAYIHAPADVRFPSRHIPDHARSYTRPRAEAVGKSHVLSQSLPQAPA